MICNGTNARPARPAPSRRRRVALAVACLFLLLLPLQAAEKTYTVKPDDTLIDVARRHGVTLARVVDRNGLTRTTKLRVGQKLQIPLPDPDRDTVTSPLLPAELDGIRADRGRWKHIVIHHSAARTATVKGMDHYHRVERHMENGLAYHFVIGNGVGMKDGQIAIGRRWAAQLDGGHLASEDLNRVSIGICLVGNYDEEGPTRKQMASLRALTEFLLLRCRLGTSAVKTHQQINPIHTRCPGRHFPTKSFLNDLRQGKSDP